MNGGHGTAEVRDVRRTGRRGRELVEAAGCVRGQEI